ncbi:MAG: alanyl-tRNA editing protein [Deltaproteobacteria bacterium]|jgi:alanyl-tRNA synthetase|nr:alanyl-tRNA editing protein [Deltaproteobacteria bacterium]MBW2530286.1 alanyl-tRNA editing protein [Deltaproteobacteria bacterium]
MSDSQRLYLDDPLRLAFEAEVVAHGRHGAKTGVVLDRTAFYAEAGGQMADRGTLDQIPVCDVQLDADGRIVHLLDGELPPVGTAVRGRVDERRRRLHMALHTGQHILSRALLDVAGAHTVSSRLGETGCTIDVRPGSVGPTERERIEQLANEIIDADEPVRGFLPDPAELSTLPLRKPSKVDHDVRVVAIGGFDLVPCGGTHCVRTAQVGLVSITGVERYKQGQRITFVSGERARRELSRDARALHELSRAMSCAPADLPAALDKLRRELSEAHEATAAAERQLAEQVAPSLLRDANPPGVAIALFDGASVSLLRAVGKRVTALDGAIALLASRTDDGMHVVLARHRSSAFDCGRSLKRVATACGGRGGGRADHAEGRLPPDVDWEALAREMVGRTK